MPQVVWIEPSQHCLPVVLVVAQSVSGRDELVVAGHAHDGPAFPGAQDDQIAFVHLVAEGPELLAAVGGVVRWDAFCVMRCALLRDALCVVRWEIPPPLLIYKPK